MPTATHVGSAPHNLLRPRTWERALDPLDVDGPAPRTRELGNCTVAKAGGEEKGRSEPASSFWGHALAVSLPRMCRKVHSKAGKCPHFWGCKIRAAESHREWGGADKLEVRLPKNRFRKDGSEPPPAARTQSSWAQLYYYPTFEGAWKQHTSINHLSFAIRLAAAAEPPFRKTTCSEKPAAGQLLSSGPLALQSAGAHRPVSGKRARRPPRTNPSPERQLLQLEPPYQPVADLLCRVSAETWA